MFQLFDLKNDTETPARPKKEEKRWKKKQGFLKKKKK